jgi:hypothetical protein
VKVKRKKQNVERWRYRVVSLTYRVKNFRQRVKAAQVLLGYLIKEMRKEEGNDEVIADLLLKLTEMLESMMTALTEGEPPKPVEKKEETDESKK